LHLTPTLDWLKASGCDLTQRNLTNNEWNTFLFNDDVQETCPQ